MFYKKGVLRNFAKFTGKHPCQSLFFKKVFNFIEKESLTQMFSREFYKFLRTLYIKEHLLLIVPLARQSGGNKRSDLLRYVRSLLPHQIFSSYYSSFRTVPSIVPSSVHFLKVNQNVEVEYR